MLVQHDLSEQRAARPGSCRAAKFPYGEFLVAGGPFQATAKLIWERFFFISRPVAREDSRNTGCHAA